MNRSIRILIVDDEPVSIEITIEFLLEKNYTINTAQDGNIAWQMLESNPESYDVILLDRMMPGMDGMQLLARIKQHPVLKQCPVIFQTARTTTDDILEGMHAGAYYYLTKPFARNQLFSILEAAVADRVHYRELRHQLSASTNSLGLMTSASFYFQTLDDVQSLALLLAKACPHPEKVVTGLSELMINAVEHGNLGITYVEKTYLNNEGQSWIDEVERRLNLEENKHKYGEISIQRVGDEILFIIRDQGTGFNWEPYMEIRVERLADNHGRGIAMSNLFSFSRLEYRGVGNEVHAFVSCDQNRQ